jgi:hypothetical protein
MKDFMMLLPLAVVAVQAMSRLGGMLAQRQALRGRAEWTLAIAELPPGVVVVERSDDCEWSVRTTEVGEPSAKAAGGCESR